MSKSLNIRIFKHKILIDSLTEIELQSLTKDFRHYKETGQKPDFFGRDQAYDHPNTLPILKSEEVRHIHLAASDAPFLSSIQFYQTSDTHLVYCQSWHDLGCFLLIAILTPDAHEQARNRTIMHNLGLIAEKFRQQF
ncbi:type II toxin-antitoxin system YafO family toxin [Vibrio metschnikovii]|uniref:type II toxin-antitoxin system YafO family toxin n=1 Tax=Vibrio metschnikovii TaxID=28172 RepID=UPI002879CDC9|nr:type II toxin-antitoxin system YafO family toxin [Vibrio metschnikovii]EKO3611086.1 type II toxin-antitoxin system YafO family toxin [Vibrio metschnikovii]EKO3684059.1 type II toxin-antitoxin system YafO family toxin [Vibrio metschnikovii]EKO3713549.1 type II toxin-antitoxin system YafO family toxin [Vibrio metschnikovii]EKO3738954.1 type II toxin-antitoxin system YafO family toxin [Vibrio metschnikovii]